MGTSLYSALLVSGLNAGATCPPCSAGLVEPLRCSVRVLALPAVPTGLAHSPTHPAVVCRWFIHVAFTLVPLLRTLVFVFALGQPCSAGLVEPLRDCA